MERIKHWWHTEADKLRPMSWKQRFSYLFTYYKSWMLGFLALLLLGSFLTDVYIQNQTPIALQGFFTNDDWNLFPASKIADAYTDTLPEDFTGRVVLDDALYIDMTGDAGEYAAASNGKIIAYITTGQLDFVVTTREVFDFLAPQMQFMDLATVLPTADFAALESQMQKGTDRDGNQIYQLLDMTQSRFVQDSGFADAEGVAGTYCLFIPYNAPDTAQLADFIRYAFGL